MNYCNIRNISKTCLAVFLISIVFCNDFACSQIDKTDSSRPVNTTNSIDNKAANPTNVENLKEKVNQFLSLDDSNPITRNSHIYYNIAVEILSYDELLDLAEKVIKKGIEINTLKNLRKTYPDMTENSIKHQQKLEFGRLYCQYAWLLWKKNQLENAYDTIKKAMNYIPLPTPNDYMRLGIIEYDNGEKPQGWKHIIEALLSDTIIEQQNPGYREALDKIIKDKFGTDKDTTVFIADYRKQNAQTIPNLDLVSLENTKIKMRPHKGQIAFVNFFSPSCGSCKLEIPSLKNLYDRFSQRDNVVFIFILNRPELKQEAINLFEKSGIDKPIIAILEKGSVWDLISEEPSIWITDKAGIVIFRHSGYKQGDELIYRQTLSKSIQD